MKIIRAKEVCQMLSISRSTLWRLERAGRIPASFQYSVRTTGWLESDILAYIDKCKKA
ncbi:AlpA family phage regulatory protein [Methylotenera sp. N17]|uniref:helix-turn-helix transcriptional regulator n=1 Tax=Methylotenera sp. N17 TaxID=1502761 RepID=UPI0009DE5C52